MKPQIWQTKRIVDTTMDFMMSAGFEQWLRDMDVSIALTAPTEWVFVIGRMDDDNVWIEYRGFDKAMGIVEDGSDRVYLATRNHIWRFDNALAPGSLAPDGYDRVYEPTHSMATGYINAHEVCVDGDGGLVAVNTRFNCLARPGPAVNFTPVWWPKFVDGPWPNDRCHLNGLAMRDGQPAYATTVSQTAHPDGWRSSRADGGTVIDIASGEIIASGLSMPHSPRWHADRIWLGNAGTGQFGYIDQDRGTFEPVVFLPGFIRGICFVGDYAVVGTSKPRRGDMYSGLALDGVLAEQRVSPLLGAFIVDLRSGEVAEYIVIEGPVRELFDIAPLHGVRRAKLLGFAGDEHLAMTRPEPEPVADLDPVWSTPWA